MTQPATWGVPRIGDAPVTPEIFADRCDDALDAALSAHSGAARPAYAVAGTLWRSTASGAWYLFDGTSDHRIATAGAVAPYTADHTLTLADMLGGVVTMTDAAALTLTVPADATEDLPVGIRVMVLRSGAGVVSIAAEGGVTLSSAAGATDISAQHGAAWLVKLAADAWALAGDLA